VQILRDIPLDGLLKKSFYDINPVDGQQTNYK
jgi:hypothetical protein